MRSIIRIFLLLAGLCNISGSKAQDITGILESHVDSIIDNLPGNSGDDYVLPNSMQRLSWGNVVTAILQKDYSTAELVADSLNYKLISYFDILSSSLYHVVEEKTPQQYYWGTYIFNSSPCRTKLVIQSPHPKYDFNTGKEGIFCFRRLGALAYCLSGTHRCNNSQASSCSGTTSSCGASSSFRVSDQPHSSDGMFQETTFAILSEVQGAVFIQLHGFSKQPTDPYVIMSNGTRETPTDDLIPLITAGLLLADPSLTFKVAHIDTNWTKLLAFTNVQGRLINASSDPCNNSATTTTGNFVHIEQEKTKLRDDSTGWNKVSQAISAAFPCDSAVVVQINKRQHEKVRMYPSPVTSALTIEANAIENISVFNLFGQKVMSVEGLLNFTTLDFSSSAPGVYLVVLVSKEDTFVRKVIKL